MMDNALLGKLSCTETGHVTKENNLIDFLFAPLYRKSSDNLTLLHLEGPKLYGVLALMSAIGLKWFLL